MHADIHTHLHAQAHRRTCARAGTQTQTQMRMHRNGSRVRRCIRRIALLILRARTYACISTRAQDLGEEVLTKEQEELVGKGCAGPPVTLDSKPLTEQK